MAWTIPVGIFGVGATKLSPVQVAATHARSLARSLLGPMAVLASAVAAVGYVHVVDPNQSGNYPTCVFLLLTGHYCPGCGGLRMVHALTHGHLIEGADLNVLGLLVLPLVGYLWLRWVISAVRGNVTDQVLPRAVVWALPVATALFWVVRNTTMGQVLAP